MRRAPEYKLKKILRIRRMLAEKVPKIEICRAEQIGLRQLANYRRDIQEMQLSEWKKKDIVELFLESVEVFERNAREATKIIKREKLKLKKRLPNGKENKLYAPKHIKSYVLLRAIKARENAQLAKIQTAKDLGLIKSSESPLVEVNMPLNEQLSASLNKIKSPNKRREVLNKLKDIYREIRDREVPPEEKEVKDMKRKMLIPEGVTFLKNTKGKGKGKRGRPRENEEEPNEPIETNKKPEQIPEAEDDFEEFENDNQVVNEDMPLTSEN